MSEKEKVANVDINQPNWNSVLGDPIWWDPAPPWLEIDKESLKRFAHLQVEFKVRELKIKQDLLKIQEEKLNQLSKMI